MRNAAGEVGGRGLFERVAVLGARQLWWLSLAAVALLRAPSFVVRLVNSDEASIATMGMVLDHGGRLYHQTADRKPPVVPYLYAAIFHLTGSFDLRPVRVLAAVVLAATAVLLASEARRRSGSDVVGVAAGVLFLLAFAAFFPDDAQAASFELFMLLPMTAAVVFAGRDHPFAAGVALALACLCKQTAITTALPVAYLVLRQRGPSGLRGLAVGFLAPIGVAAAAFGPGPFLLWTVTGNGGYLRGQGALVGVIVRAVAMTAALTGLEIGLVALCFAALYKRTASLDLWLWLMSAAVAVTAGFRFFGHYYFQLVPASVLIAAPVVVGLSKQWRNLALAALAAPALVCTMIGFFPTGDAASIPYAQIADRVRAETRPNEQVFVWGDLPEVYWSSRREPATRFVHTGFLTGNSGGRQNGAGDDANGVPGSWDMLSADFHKRLPDLIVDTSTTDIRQQQYYPLSKTLLWPIVTSHYRYVGSVAGVRLYHLSPARS